MTRMIKRTTRRSRSDTITLLSPVNRVRNNYEALYYNVDSDDPDMDDILKEEIQRAFEQRGVTLLDNPNDDVLREIMLDACVESVKKIGGRPLSQVQEERIEQEFDKFTSEHSSFYELSFKTYEYKYKEFVDEKLIDARLAQNADNEHNLSYIGCVPEAVEQTTRRAYRQRKQLEEKERDELADAQYAASQQGKPSDFKEYDYDRLNNIKSAQYERNHTLER